MNLEVTLWTMHSILYFMLCISLEYTSVKGEKMLDKITKIESQNSCDEDFLQQINNCMDPFAKNAKFYTTTKPQNPLVNQIFVKYVCRRYEKMLLCVHTVLANCPTMDNIQIVQSRLSISWALEINQMCNIHSNPMDNVSNKTTSDNEMDIASDKGEINTNKDSLETDNSNALLPQTNILNSKQTHSRTITKSHSSTERHKIIPLQSTEDVTENKISEKLNNIVNGNKVLSPGQGEIITTVIKYKSRPKSWWSLTQSVRMSRKSNKKFTKMFEQQKDLFELIQTSVIGNFNVNQISNIAPNVPESAYFQSASSAAKSIILQGHMSWHMMLFLAFVNIIILSISL